MVLLKLPRPTLPHQTTDERVLDKLDIEAFEQQVSTYFAGQKVKGETINVDGKPYLERHGQKAAVSR